MRLFTHDYDYVLITGATGSGKSTLAEELVNNYAMDYKKKTTTRPKRPNESDMEYIRITHDEMDALEKNNLLASRICPETAHGIWEYGIPKYNRLVYTDRTNVQALGLDDIKNLSNTDPNWFPYNSILIILYVDKKTLLTRLKDRQDDEESIRRINSDIFMLGETPDDDTQFHWLIRDTYQRDTQFKVLHIINHNFQYSIDNLIHNMQNYQRNLFYNRQFTIFNKSSYYSSTFFTS